MADKILRKIDLEHNHLKFYRVYCPVGSQSVLHQWGRINEWVQEQWTHHESHEQAIKDYSQTLKAKLREGYTESDWAVMPQNYRKYGRPLKAQPVDQLPLFEP